MKATEDLLRRWRDIAVQSPESWVKIDTPVATRPPRIKDGYHGFKPVGAFEAIRRDVDSNTGLATLYIRYVLPEHQPGRFNIPKDEKLE